MRTRDHAHGDLYNYITHYLYDAMMDSTTRGSVAEVAQSEQPLQEYLVSLS